MKFEECGTSEKYKYFTGNSNGLFMVESEDMMKGGMVEWNGSYRLKHLSTGMYLAV